MDEKCDIGLNNLSEVTFINITKLLHAKSLLVLFKARGSNFHNLTFVVLKESPNSMCLKFKMFKVQFY